MSNPLLNVFNPMGKVGTQLPGQFGNLSNFMNNFNSFRQMLGNNPGQNAEQLVRQMLSSGQISQEQFNQAKQLATTLQQVTGL